MNILSIDPGYEQSAWVLNDSDARRPLFMGIQPNDVVLRMVARATLEICNVPADCLVIEMVASFGMAVGKEVFETVFWIGRFFQVFDGDRHRLFRRDVKMHLCGNNTAKDSNIRQSLIDLFGPGETKAIGKKATPGPLYGVSKDLWAALAVAVTFADTKLGKEMAHA